MPKKSDEADSQGFWLDVMYPATLADELNGGFPLHTPAKWADERSECLRFHSGDEPGLTPGTLMQSAFYLFKRRGKADQSFQYACKHLAGWRDSHKGTEYLVKLRKGSITGDLISRHKGTIGENSAVQTGRTTGRNRS